MASLGVLLWAFAACQNSGTAGARFIQPQYDEQTGRLKQLAYDSDKNGRTDTISYMDGARVLRIEIDKDEDGKVDRWEHYGPDQKLEKIGVSRPNDGKEDAWSFAGPDGAITRVEISLKRDGKITRIEHFEDELPVRAEEDVDADGRMDKWETFEAGRLTSVSFDSTHRGTPDRRIVYGADGEVRVEVDPDGDGRFDPVKR
jgi:hypothetical protein